MVIYESMRTIRFASQFVFQRFCYRLGQEEVVLAGVLLDSLSLSKIKFFSISSVVQRHNCFVLLRFPVWLSRRFGSFSWDLHDLQFVNQSEVDQLEYLLKD